MTAIGSALCRLADITAILVVLSTGAVLLAGIGARALRTTGGSANGALPEAVAGSLALDAPALGPREAPVTVVLFNDYRCGFCGAMHDSLTAMLRRYPQHLRVVVRHYVTSAEDPMYMIALGAECAAEQGAFARYHETAFRIPAVLSYSNAYKAIVDSSRLEGFDHDAFETCVISRRYTGRLNDDREWARRLGVSGTPTIFVNGVPIIGAVPLATLDSVIAAALPKRQSKQQ